MAHKKRGKAKDSSETTTHLSACPFRNSRDLEHPAEGRGFRIRYVNFGRYPDARPVVDRYNGLVVLGGPMHVDDVAHHPHLATEVLLIQLHTKRFAMAHMSTVSSFTSKSTKPSSNVDSAFLSTSKSFLHSRGGPRRNVFGARQRPISSNPDSWVIESFVTFLTSFSSPPDGKP